MKIGIITIHNSPNYGACLQAFSLYEYLRQQGYDVEIIDLLRPYFKEFKASKKFKPYQHNTLPIKQKIKRIIISLLKHNNENIGQPKQQYISPLSLEKFKEFNSHIKYSKQYNSIDELYKNPPQYDVYITGSDQVWNPTQDYCLEPYFLTFVRKGKKISYASSIGINELNNKEKRDFSKWLSSYDMISVREVAAKQLLQPLLKDKKIEIVADPTFLLDIDFWGKLIIKPSIKNYILLFTLSYDTSMVDYGLKLCKESNKKLVVLNLNQPNILNPQYIPITDAGPKEFLGYIANADMIITDSFHCTVFSIILKVPQFFTYIAPWNLRGSRITNLLKTFHLENHLLKQDKSQNWEELNHLSINYSDIEKTYVKEQVSSRSYLLRQIPNKLDNNGK